MKCFRSADNRSQSMLLIDQTLSHRQQTSTVLSVFPSRFQRFDGHQFRVTENPGLTQIVKGALQNILHCSDCWVAQRFPVLLGEPVQNVVQAYLSEVCQYICPSLPQPAHFPLEKAPTKSSLRYESYEHPSPHPIHFQPTAAETVGVAALQVVGDAPSPTRIHHAQSSACLVPRLCYSISINFRLRLSCNSGGPQACHLRKQKEVRTF